MDNYRMAMRLLIIGCVSGILIGILLLSTANQDWGVTEEGLLHYSVLMPEYQLTPLSNNNTLYEVRFESKDMQMAGLLRKPSLIGDKGLSGIVLLPGASVTKEREQGLAKYLSSLGYASITLDQRNMGVFDMQRDWKMFLNNKEPAEHKMVYDALVAAEILRNQPEIDPSRIVYAGESNGGRFAIIACALDPKAKGVVAISTCGYGTDDLIASGTNIDPDTFRFYRSIDPNTYPSMISPRRFVMIHSSNDPIISSEQANRTYAAAYEPKDLNTVDCAKHGYCSEMNSFLEKELADIVS